MQVKELAELAGTTVRAVRYYHEIGLLPVPGVRDGRRDYDLTHVARLIRIRWLAQAGVPLSRVVGMLRPAGESERQPPEAVRESVLTDLGATVVALEEQLEQLTAQLGRVRRLITAVERHDHLSPLPAAIARFYDTIEQRAEDDSVRRVIRRERDFMELAFYRGEMPPEVEVVYQGFDESRMADSVTLFGRVADRYESGSVPTEEEGEQLAAAVVERFRRHLGPRFSHLARSVDVDAVRRAADLYVRLAKAENRRLDRVIADALLSAIEEARTK